ncbi:IS110 family transposase, partial [Rhodococcus sp. ARC_M5]|uniref:IS110 family transposase n=1 Tax=Rhodococcus sp. ARC_M5 TaxID=2928851 RepID=UPI001FB550E2
MTDNPPDVSTTVFVGVDTHKNTNHAAIIDHLGREVGDREFPTTAAGHVDLIAWITAAGKVERIGVEGTGSYGSTLATALRLSGLEVVDVDRPDRRSRRFHGKSDPLDAHSAARAALTGKATTTPKAHDGNVEAVTQLKSMIVNAPEGIRAELRQLTDAHLFAACAALPHAPRR